MKTIPTKGQWAIRTKKQIEFFQTQAWWHEKDVTIATMIEFLGDDLEDMTNCKGDWHVYLKNSDHVEDELFDALYIPFITKVDHEYEKANH